MPRRVVVTGFYAYRARKSMADGRGGTVERDVMLRPERGAVIDVSAAEAQRGDALGALAPVDSGAVEVAAPVSTVPVPESVGFDWVGESTANEVMERVGDDAALASLVADVEAGGKNRTSLIAKLHKVATATNQS